jgi:octaprenyl-diphosphate synthase
MAAVATSLPATQRVGTTRPAVRATFPSVERYFAHFASLEAVMHGQVEAFEVEIRDMAAYCLDTTGKRVRPLLVFAAGWGTGNRDQLVKLAAVIEMVHLATLVHDDIMDRADSRRNRPTAARAFGPGAAVLLGDTLFAQAVHLSTQFDTTEVCREVSAAARRVCSGEIIQSLGRGPAPKGLDRYWRVIELKTAELFRVACRLGASVAGRDRAFVEAAEEFGRHLGIAFQIYDDLADCVGREDVIGKTLGTDFVTGKLTLPLQLLRERAGETELAALDGRDPDLLVKLRTLMQHHKADEGTLSAIEAHLRLAEKALEPHAALEPTALLLELSAYLQQASRSLVR